MPQQDRRIQRGPVRGISLKLQQEERERRIDFDPDESAIRVEYIEVDKETFDMLDPSSRSASPTSRSRPTPSPRRWLWSQAPRLLCLCELPRSSPFL